MFTRYGMYVTFFKLNWQEEILLSNGNENYDFIKTLLSNR